MKPLFSKEYINTCRQPELDVFKGIAIFVMVFTHTIMWHLPEDMASAGTDLLYKIGLVFSGPPEAPAFMFCMGLGIWFSAYNHGNRQSLLEGYLPGGLFKRGLYIFIVGLIINVIRALILPGVAYLIDPDPYYLEAMLNFFGSDIYQFAALALFTMAIIQKLHIKAIWMLPIGLVFSGLGWLLRGVSTGIRALDLFLSLIWGSSEYAFFPLLNWFIFPVVGFLVAKYLARCVNKTKLYTICGILGAVLYNAYVIYCMITDSGFLYIGEYDGFYAMSSIDMLFYMAAVLEFISIAYVITRVFKKCSFKLLYRWSHNIMEMYSFQWILIILSCSIEVLFDIELLPFVVILLIGFIVLILCDILSEKFNNQVKPKLMHKFSK